MPEFGEGLARRAEPLSSSGFGPIDGLLSLATDMGTGEASGDRNCPFDWPVGGVNGGSCVGLGGRTMVFAAPAAPVTFADTSERSLEIVVGAASFHCRAVM